VRKLMAASLIGFGFAAAVFVYTLLPLGSTLPSAYGWLPIIPSYVTAMAVMFGANGWKIGVVPWRNLWRVIRSIPRPVVAGLAVLLTAVLINQFTASGDAADMRVAAGSSGWLCAVAAALAYGYVRMREAEASGA
jgi:hypothetical protein